MIFGTRSVYFLMDSENIIRPERSTVLIARELAERSICKPKGGYTFYLERKWENKDIVHGVGLTIRTTFLHQLPDPPMYINEWLIKLHFPLNSSCHVAVISSYAPTMSSSDDHDSLVKSTPANDKLLLLGDYRVIPELVMTLNWKGMLGHHSLGKMNSSGLLLVSFCAENYQMITNTLFKQATKCRTTWMHPRSKQWHLLDYVICCRLDNYDVWLTTAMWGADFWVDNRLVRTILLLHILPKFHKSPSSFCLPSTLRRWCI